MLVKIRGCVQYYSVLSRMCLRVCGEWVIIVTPAFQLPDIVRAMRSLATNACNYSQCHIAKCRYRILYFVGRASRYRFLEITNLTHFFMYLFIYLMSLHVSNVTAIIIRRSNFINTSSGMISQCK